MFTSPRQPLQHQRRGFSLVELLVVIGVIAILASLLFYAGQNARKAARDAQRIEDIKELSLAFEAYVLEYGRLPECPTGFRIEPGFQKPATCVDGADVEFAQFVSFLTDLLDEVPADPLGPGDATYYYYYDSAQQCSGSADTALIFAKMEIPENANQAAVCRQFADCGQGNDGDYNCVGAERAYPYAHAF